MGEYELWVNFRVVQEHMHTHTHIKTMTDGSAGLGRVKVPCNPDWNRYCFPWTIYWLSLHFKAYMKITPSHLICVGL